MKLLLSGEGPTDLGVNRPVAGGVEFVPGPMAHVVDRLLGVRLGYSLLEVHAAGGGCVSYVGESELASLGKTGSPLLPGLKFGKGTALYTRNAQVLGLTAIEARSAATPVIAVLFRDGDGTRSVPRADWERKVASIERGFELVSFDAGVPMVPRPKSEAWLLCALKPQAYTHCDSLEDAPGNDASPNSLKKAPGSACGSRSVGSGAVRVGAGRLGRSAVDRDAQLPQIPDGAGCGLLECVAGRLRVLRCPERYRVGPVVDNVGGDGNARGVDVLRRRRKA